MKKIIFSLLVIMSVQAQADWDASVIVGEWENYQYGYDHKYQKLIINKNYSGSYFHIRGNSDGEVVAFKKDDFKFFDGFAVLDVDDNFKILLSAWGSNITSKKRLLAQLFIYEVDGKEIKLINSIPANFYSASKESFNEFSEKVKRVQQKNR